MAKDVPPVAELPRYGETFPVLTGAEMTRLARFGAVRRCAAGEALFLTGRPAPGMFILRAGRVAVTQHDGLGHVAPVIEQGPGGFLGEIAALAGEPALVDGHAAEPVEAILIPPEGVRALLIAEAELGERIMRAMILRRVALIGSHAGGPVLVGSRLAAGTLRLQSFLSRNGHPHQVLDPELDAEAAEVIARYQPAPHELPLVFCPDGTMLRNPGDVELARCLGMVAFPSEDTVYDVAVVGGGPGGLATAVYAASEGLSVCVLDARAYGGQAGASARIENYLGFPTGISGLALTGRAYVQAQKFGVAMLIPVEAKALDCSRAGGVFGLDIEGGCRIRARAVVIASGARYRRPAIANLAEYEGRGVWYWASPIEAKLAQGQEVVLVGGGNSAGQAAVFLSAQAAKVRMMVRGPGLAASMSRYLIDRIAQTPNIELVTGTEIVALAGSPEAGLERVRWRDHRSGTETEAPVRQVFLFVGADPATQWLEGCGVATDRTGFVLTGGATNVSGERPVGALESSVQGVFAVGDVRAGSVKRVGGAIGEGASVVPLLHSWLATLPNARPEGTA